MAIADPRPPGRSAPRHPTPATLTIPSVVLTLRDRCRCGGSDGYVRLDLQGGERLGDDDELDVRLLRPAQVHPFADHLASLTSDELSRRLDLERMTTLRIYPEVWQRPEHEDDPCGYLLGAFAELRDFVAAAAAAGDTLVVCIA